MTEKTTEPPEAPATPNGEQVGEHPFVSRFRGCKHLDYEGDYGDCTKESFHGVGVAWMRHTPYPDAPKVVQFCKLRGRLNQISACIGECNAQCHEYDEVEHAVEYNGERLSPGSGAETIRKMEDNQITEDEEHTGEPLTSDDLLSLFGEMARNNLRNCFVMLAACIWLYFAVRNEPKLDNFQTWLIGISGMVAGFIFAFTMTWFWVRVTLKG